MTALAIGTLCIARASGDWRCAVARNCYVIMCGEAGLQDAWRCRPVNRNGAHHQDRTFKTAELVPIAAFGVRIKWLDRDTRLLVVEPDPDLPHTATNRDGSPLRWESELWGLGWRTFVDHEAITYIADPQPLPKEATPDERLEA